MKKILTVVFILLVACEDEKMLEDERSLPLLFENSAIKVELVTDSVGNSSIYFLDQATGFVTTSWAVLDVGGDYLLKTSDDGLTWTKVLDVPGRVQSIYFDPKTPGLGFLLIKFLSIGGSGGALYKTIDNGETWIEVCSGDNGFSSMAITDGPGRKILLYGATRSRFPSTNIHTITRSDDDGTTWVTVYDGYVNDLPYYAPVRVLNSKHIVVFKDDFISNDYGTSWTEFKKSNALNCVILSEKKYVGYGISYDYENERYSLVETGNEIQTLFNSEFSLTKMLPGIAIGYNYYYSESDGEIYQGVIAYKDDHDSWKEMILEAMGQIRDISGYRWDKTHLRYRYYFLIDSKGKIIRLTMK